MDESVNKKANELIHKFVGSGRMGGAGIVPICYYESACICAKIAVQEIIDNAGCVNGESVSWWVDVKNEIEKIQKTWEI